MPLLHGTMVKNATLSIFGTFLIFSGNWVTQQNKVLEDLCILIPPYPSTFLNSLYLSILLDIICF